MFVLAVVAIAYYFYFIKNKETLPILTDEEKLEYADMLTTDPEVVEAIANNELTSESDKIKVYLITKHFKQLRGSPLHNFKYEYLERGDEFILSGMDFNLSFNMESGSNIFNFVKKKLDGELIELNQKIESGEILCDDTTYTCIDNPDFVPPE